MPEIICPHCGQAHSISPEQRLELQGQQITCSKCNQPFPVMAAAPPLAAAMPGGPAAGSPPAGYAPGGYGQPPYMPPGGYYPPPRKSMSPGAVVAIVLAVVIGGIGVIALLIAILVPSLGRAREQANRAKCANNLRQLSLACLMYSNANIRDRSNFPDSIDSLVNGPLAQEIGPSVVVCPATTDTPPNGNWSDLKKPGHLSYVYVGRGLSASSSGPTTVLFYEPLSVHHNEGCNMAFADAHVEFIPRAKAQKMINELNAGQNPPPSANLP